MKIKIQTKQICWINPATLMLLIKIVNMPCSLTLATICKCFQTSLSNSITKLLKLYIKEPFWVLPVQSLRRMTQVHLLVGVILFLGTIKGISDD